MSFKTNDQMDKSFLTASIPEVIKQMTEEEKISLLAGKDWWNIKVTDGPNGARGESFYHMCPATALPNATCLGATFSSDLAELSGSLLADETRARNASCLLAPTINIQRSPLGGRAFESFAEDPTLSGLIAAGYIRGLQDKGVSATIKHFVANDQEHERMGQDSIIAARPLRDIYLRPFQIAQKHSQPWAFMTAYNKLNGTHCSENPWLLQNILRGEWKFDGLVMSDWYGTYSVSESVNAGLDLEMPGPAKWRQKDLISHMLYSHKIDPRTLDKRVSEILNWVQKLAKLNEGLVYAKSSKEKTRLEHQEADAKILRRIGGEGIVLLKNEQGVLPLNKPKSKVGVIGPNAKTKVLTGGGSAMLRASWSVSPWEGLVNNKPDDVELFYSLGATTSKFLPILGEEFTTLDKKAGFDLRHYAIDKETGEMKEDPVVVEQWDTSDMLMGDFYHPDLGDQYCTELSALFTPRESAEWEFESTITGQAWLWIDEEMIIDNSKYTSKGTAYFGSGSDPAKGTFRAEAGKSYKIRYLHDSRVPSTLINVVSTPLNIVGMRLGAFPKIDPEQSIVEAVELAKTVDVPLIIAGLNADWESEGYDRPDLSLPLRTNELIARVAEVNPKTVVVIQAGSAVSMPWINQVSGIVYAWYGGNECGNSIADVVYGNINPSGRLPLTLPVKEEDIPASLNYKSARTKTYYEEGIWVGYRWYNERKIKPLFPFGHGLSYTTFEYSNLKITAQSPGGTKADEWKLDVSVDLKNTGEIVGSHSVHFYTCPPEETPTSLKHPEQTLQAFKKVQDLKPGEKVTVKVTLDKYAISHWDEGWNTFRAELGEWSVKIGKDAETMVGDARFVIDEEIEWTGL
uniref:beta-glucosidase n=1 Tax=Kwoniella bestiolae CBS 10118 TaxID=1296100 RepID=A0A1B9FXF8_9TREE|nr:beta-glucosidase [Kwoniella bestiolae CBS 10118]OCF23446.1 beta-glucosidase [Kwoniella bestiolae CBS 10118]